MNNINQALPSGVRLKRIAQLVGLSLGVGMIHPLWAQQATAPAAANTTEEIVALPETACELSPLTKPLIEYERTGTFSPYTIETEVARIKSTALLMVTLPFTKAKE